MRPSPLAFALVAGSLLTAGAALMPNYLGTPAAAAPAAVAAVPVQAAAPAAAPVAAGSGDQCAQMGGVVAGILVKEGQSVSEGEKIAELEAMLYGLEEFDLKELPRDGSDEPGAIGDFLDPAGQFHIERVGAIGQDDPQDLGPPPFQIDGEQIGAKAGHAHRRLDSIGSLA